MRTRLPGRIEEAWGPLMRSSRFNQPTRSTTAAAEEIQLVKKDENPESPYAEAQKVGYLGSVPDKTPNQDYALGGAVSEGDKPDPALPQSPSDRPAIPQAPAGPGDEE